MLGMEGEMGWLLSGHRRDIDMIQYCHDLERISRVPDFFCYIYQTRLLL